MEKLVLLGNENVQLCSSSNVVPYKFEWMIENFSFYVCLEDEFRCLKSPVLQNEDKSYSCSLDLYYNGSDKNSEGYISIYFSHNSEINGCITKATLSLLECPTIPKRDLSISTSLKGLGYAKFMSREDLFKDPVFLLKDSLTVLCEIKVLEFPGGQSKTKISKNEKNSLSDNLKSLLNNHDLYDTTLQVDQKEFKVHKFMLAARSSVFAAMFSHGFKEKQANTVKIENASPIIMEEVIHYLYTDEFPKLKELVEDVLPIADKYALLGLKDMCAEELYSQLTIGNATHILLLADKYRVKALKENIINFIVTNSKAVIATHSWREMEANKHPMVTEIALAVLSKLHLNEVSY